MQGKVQGDTLILDPQKFKFEGNAVVAIGQTNGYIGNDQIIFEGQDEDFPDCPFVPSWNRGKPKFMRFLNMVISPILKTYSVFSTFGDAYSLQNATGKQLDTIGELLGCSRVLPVVFEGHSRTLDDDQDYRLLLRATIAKQHWDGTLKGLLNIINTLFDQFDIQIVQEFHQGVANAKTGQFRIMLNSNKQISDVQMQMILSDLLFPHPAGVKMSITASDPITAATINSYAGVMQVSTQTVTTGG